MTEERVQRRLTAILAADVAGYSRLMGEDEEGTLAALNAHRGDLIDPLVVRFGGHLVKSTGDGLLLEFPSVVDALACALAIQRGMATRNSDVPAARRLEFRVGINIGDVIVQDDDVFGDGVNVAARLQEQAPPGGICLSDDAYRQVRGRLPCAARDGGERRLKNIARPVRLHFVDPSAASDPAASAAAPRPAGHRRRKAIVAATAALVLMAAAGLWLAWERFGPPPAAVTATDAGSFPVIAVLPFANQTGDDAQAYFADGVTEDVINALSRFNTLRVIARNAVLPYRGRAAPPETVAADLGASYLVQGSVRRAAAQVRIAAAFVDARRNTVLWSSRYEGTLDDVFAFQDTMAREIAGTLAAKVTRIEAQRSLDRPRPSAAAYDLILRARAVGFAATRAANRRFRELMERAVEIDPGYAKSYALLAEAVYNQAIQGWTEFPDRALAEGEALARKAITLAPDEPDGHRALGRLLVVRREYEAAKYELRRAIALNPSDADALAVSGTVSAFDGDIDGGVRSLELALRFDPMLEANYVFDLAVAYHLARRDQDALRTAELGLARFPAFPMLYVPAAAAAARLGRAAEAARYAHEIRTRLPFLDLDVLGSRFRDPAYPAYLKDGLRRAGL